MLAGQVLGARASRPARWAWTTPGPPARPTGRVCGTGWVEGLGSVRVVAQHALHASSRRTSDPLQCANQQDDSRVRQAWMLDVHVRAEAQSRAHAGLARVGRGRTGRMDWKARAVVLPCVRRAGPVYLMTGYDAPKPGSVRTPASAPGVPCIPCSPGNIALLLAPVQPSRPPRPAV